MDSREYDLEVDERKLLAEEEYVEQVKNYYGAMSYYCNLCGCQFDAKLMLIHSTGQAHQNLLKAVKERETLEDRLVVTKNEQLSPTEEELQAVKNIVTSCEKALKLVSDILLKEAQGTDALSDDEDEMDKMTKEKPDKDPGLVLRSIKGLVHAGVFANGLMMRGETDVQLVLLSADKPTEALLDKITYLLPQQLSKVSEDKYDVETKFLNACFIMRAQKAPHASCTVSLTCSLMRPHPFTYYNEQLPPDPEDVLPRAKCMEALRDLRRARWFESKAAKLPYCEVVMLIFRDLCQRVPTWISLDLWTIQLLVHKCLETAEGHLSPGLAVQRLFECIASGMLIGDTPGFYDPCEREPVDILSTLGAQLKEDITSSAQHALRLVSFQQMHKILGMSLDDLPACDDKLSYGGMKRKLSHGCVDVTADGAKFEGKKDRKLYQKTVL
jgi:zinc finger RNA-binding protein